MEAEEGRAGNERPRRAQDIGRAAMLQRLTRSGTNQPTNRRRRCEQGFQGKVSTSNQEGAPFMRPKADSPHLCHQAALLALSVVFSGIRPEPRRTIPARFLALNPGNLR